MYIRSIANLGTVHISDVVRVRCSAGAVQVQAWPWPSKLAILLLGDPTSTLATIDSAIAHIQHVADSLSRGLHRCSALHLHLHRTRTTPHSVTIDVYIKFALAPASGALVAVW